MTWLHRYTLDTPQPVAKHPGHGDQAVHSPRKGGGAGAGGSSAEADAKLDAAANSVSAETYLTSQGANAMGNSNKKLRESRDSALQASREVSRAAAHLQDKSIAPKERISRANASMERAKMHMRNGRGSHLVGGNLERFNRVDTAVNDAAAIVSAL